MLRQLTNSTGYMIDSRSLATLAAVSPKTAMLNWRAATAQIKILERQLGLAPSKPILDIRKLNSRLVELEGMARAQPAPKTAPAAPPAPAVPPVFVPDTTLSVDAQIKAAQAHGVVSGLAGQRTYAQRTALAGADLGKLAGASLECAKAILAKK
jgi:hypothetical protein